MRFEEEDNNQQGAALCWLIGAALGTVAMAVIVAYFAGWLT